MLAPPIPRSLSRTPSRRNSRISGAASAALHPFPDPIPPNGPAIAPGFLLWKPEMTHCETTPVPALDFAAWDRREREHLSRADDLLPANKTALFDALAAANITIVVVTFDGYGDSGQIESIEAKAGDEIVTLPHGAIEIARPMWGSNDIDRQSLSIHDAIEALVYSFLGQTHDGWENSDGAYGDFTFDVADRTITLDYNERRMESDYSQHVF
jgi:hypothetical protein